MLKRDELKNVRDYFSVNHIYALAEYPHHNATVSKHELELSHFEGCCFVVVHGVHEHVKESPVEKAKWLIDVVFSFGKHHEFKSSKDAHVHVMVSLETLHNVAEV